MSRYGTKWHGTVRKIHVHAPRTKLSLYQLFANLVNRIRIRISKYILCSLKSKKLKTQLPECAQFTDIKSIKATRGTRWTKITNEMNEALINLDTGHR